MGLSLDPTEHAAQSVTRRPQDSWRARTIILIALFISPKKKFYAKYLPQRTSVDVGAVLRVPHV